MLKIVFSYPTELPNEIALVNELLASNIDYFHLRKPEYEESQLIEYIKQLNEVYYYKIIIHNHYRLVHFFNIGGIHLNQKGLSELRTEEESDRCYIEPLLLKNGKILVNGKGVDTISYGAHSFEDINAINFKIDYVTLSPIFDSISKTNYRSKFENHKQLRSDLMASNHKVIALGGVQDKHIEKITVLGFVGYALLGAYWKKLAQH